MKAILMSIKPQHLVNILNGKTDIELRKKFPSDYRGWVYAYCTKTKPYLFRLFGMHFIADYLDPEVIDDGLVKNGLVVCRFWVDNVEEVFVEGDNADHYMYHTSTLNQEELLCKSCVNTEYLWAHLILLPKTLLAIHISKLEIFDKPKELSEFYYYKKRLIDCGRDCPPYVCPPYVCPPYVCPPYFDEVKTQVRKAPQSWQYIYIEEESK